MTYEYREELCEVYNPERVLDGNTEKFNQWGSEGWNLAGVVPVAVRANAPKEYTQLAIFYFKREISN
jgi:hypothetical protein